MNNTKNVTNSIILGECISTLKELNDESVDLIFADPPYNLQLEKDLFRPNQSKVDGVFDDWDQFESLKAYEEFSLQWIKEVKRVLKKDGSFWVIGSYHNIFKIGNIIQDLGFWILNDVIWVKSNPMPNFMGTRFNNAHETLIWCTPHKESKFTFNYKEMKHFNTAEDEKQMRSDWIIPICQGEERLKDDEGNKLHSTQKPEELLFRVILSSSNPGDVVLDPFSGTGTTCAVAKKLGRQYIGIEMDETYHKGSIERLEKVVPVDPSLLNFNIRKNEIKVPIGTLISNELFTIGEYFFSNNGKNRAALKENGTLILERDGFIGSIHKVSAHLLNKKSNNGWTYWFVKRGNDFVSIDTIRKKYIQEHYTDKDEEIKSLFD